MPEYQTNNGNTQLIVSLTIAPYTHQALPTITGNPFSDEAGAVLYGHYDMAYLLPGGDRLQLIANHNQKTVQLVLFTNQAELIKQLPGERHSSIIANLISTIQRYCICSNSYVHPLTLEQEQKVQIAIQCIQELRTLLKNERQLHANDHSGRERLRRTAIAIIEQGRDQNRLLANHPLISEGSLGDALYNARQIAQQYVFNRSYKVSREDQMDFSQIHKKDPSKTSFIWDSELHIGHNSYDLDDAIRTICQYYKLDPASDLNNIPANRFAKASAFFHKLWHDGQDWVKYLAKGTKPEQKTEVEERSDGVSITQIAPYYKLQGLTQKAYKDLNELIQESKTDSIRYFTHQGHYYPLPTGQDLYTLAQISKRHLYFPQRAMLKFKAFISRIPSFTSNFYQSLHQFIVQDLQQDFTNHIHASHPALKPHDAPMQQERKQISKRTSLVKALKSNGYLANGQTMEEFIQEQISKSPYVIARPNHLPSPPAYENPLHRILGVLRHIAGIFINTSERNPLIGSLAMAAYAYGGSSILAPDLLKNILTKLQLNGLISGIEPTQKFARFLNQGQYSQAVSASAIFWQGTVVGGNLDKFFIQAIQVLKNEPGEVAIILALALSLGYGMTKAIPALGNEMGDFPYTNYAALGGKTGAAVYDVVMHPGDDWLLGTCKWLCKGFISLAKLFVAPFVEGYYYGFYKGFINGWKKSLSLFVQIIKQISAASADFLLALLTVPLLEISALFIHVPYRGITGILTKTLSFLGHITDLSNLLLFFATRPSLTNPFASFKLSPLYGFSSPFANFSAELWINLGLNAASLVFWPPIQLIKNLVILPLIDVISLSVRLSIAILDPLSRILAYSAGMPLYVFGNLWDHSFGSVFTLSAQGLSTVFNWINTQAGTLKQYLLSQIEVIRSTLYQWAFAEAISHPPNTTTDSDYFLNQPDRYELIPHTDSHCLLNALLDEKNNVSSQPDSSYGQPVYTDLFAKPRHSHHKLLHCQESEPRP